MKLLFNYAGNGEIEIKNALGFTDADLLYENLRPTLLTATDDLIKIIGRPIYDDLIVAYESGSSDQIDIEFIERVQYILALDSYRNYVIESDLAHTNNGRVNRIEDNQKIAFEWQIEKSNKSMERKFYKAINTLIHFMDQYIPQWKETQAFKNSHSLFIRTVEEFDDWFNIDGSRFLMIKLSPGIRKIETEQILPRIGKTLFEQLKSDLKSGSEYNTELLLMIQEALVYATLSWGIPRMSAQLFPEGLLQPTDNARMTYSSRKSIENNLAEALSQRFGQDADKAFKKIEEYISNLNTPNKPVEPVKPNFKLGDGFVDT